MIFQFISIFFSAAIQTAAQLLIIDHQTATATVTLVVVDGNCTSFTIVSQSIIIWLGFLRTFIRLVCTFRMIVIAVVQFNAIDVIRMYLPLI